MSVMLSKQEVGYISHSHVLGDHHAELMMHESRPKSAITFKEEESAMTTTRPVVMPGILSCNMVFLRNLDSGKVLSMHVFHDDGYGRVHADDPDAPEYLSKQQRHLDCFIQETGRKACVFVYHDGGREGKLLESYLRQKGIGHIKRFVTVDQEMGDSHLKTDEMHGVYYPKQDRLALYVDAYDRGNKPYSTEVEIRPFS